MSLFVRGSVCFSQLAGSCPAAPLLSPSLVVPSLCWSHIPLQHGGSPWPACGAGLWWLYPGSIHHCHESPYTLRVGGEGQIQGTCTGAEDTWDLLGARLFSGPWLRGLQGFLRDRRQWGGCCGCQMLGAHLLLSLSTHFPFLSFPNGLLRHAVLGFG